jgi:hypothetical protein
MTLNWFNPPTLGGNSVQQPVSTFDQEQSDHWEELADMAYYQRMAMQEELDEQDDIPMIWSEDQPSECQQINTTQLEDCT